MLGSPPLGHKFLDPSVPFRSESRDAPTWLILNGTSSEIFHPYSFSLWHAERTRNRAATLE
jgi:hypothetical protein